MAFLEDPRLRQRWNQISHNAEAVTENAAAGIWTFQNQYIGPCLASIAQSIDSCTGVCFGDREERARRARERERGARGSRAEFSFDFYDDWDDDDAALADTFGGGSGGGHGLLGSWGGGRSEDWDRLLAGTGSRGRHTIGASAGDVVDQPRRKRGMSYGTRGSRRKSVEHDPTIIPSTAPLGFLSKLPFKIGGTLRYKPSAANLKDHPSGPTHPTDEHEPLLATDDEDYTHNLIEPQRRKRSGTTGSGDTSDSYRSRGDLFPSDGEGDEDAVPIDDEFAVALDRVDDRSSGKTRLSKGKRRESYRTMSRSASGTTIMSQRSNGSLIKHPSTTSLPVEEEAAEDADQSLQDLRREEERVQREEDGEIERKRLAAAELARRRGLSTGNLKGTAGEVTTRVPEVAVDEDVPEQAALGATDTRENMGEAENSTSEVPQRGDQAESQEEETEEGFVPARLPYFR
ncbi:uncharacterized protein E0L32_011145 [Thyridium curvatum]|uniref:Uncharacterized protein n=1 Tax=Thyridium curvatum TaxID=1093900 RepID=A0A507AQ07_9PEZI|nr:uncharacterized protein E0L32_011145 [Thyridium curvatum]TPX06921.1 hypothetical protein E0L32_011145 [Thyridium curvatum]